MKHILPLLLGIFLLVSCTPENQLADTSFFAMDTVITLRLPSDTPDEVLTETTELVTALEALLSRTDPASEISRFNTQTDDTMTLSAHTAKVLSTALMTAEATNGAYDPTTAPLTELWNITADAPTVPQDTDIRNALETVGYSHLSLDGTTLTRKQPDVTLDLGGCAKGYACGAVVDCLRELGVPHGIVSFGGNIGILGKKPDGTDWRIAVKNPKSPANIAGYLSLSDGFVSVSGDYERYFESDGVRYHHIFDAKTGYPARNGVNAAVVWSRDAALADALSTALFVMGAEDGMAFYESGTFAFEALWYLDDGTVILTPGIADSYEHTAPEYRLQSNEA